MLAMVIITSIALALVAIGGIMFFGSVTGNYPFVDAVISTNSKLAIALYLMVFLMLMYGAIPMILGIGIIIVEIRTIKTLLK